MPLTLSLLRHAKSSWDDAGIEDIDRPLNSRGRKAAPAMGAWIAANGIKPDLVLCSTAARTRETLALLLPSWKPKPEVRYDKALYLAELEGLLALIAATPAAVGHLMIVGHNPGLHDVATGFSNAGDKDLRTCLTDKFPTAGLAVITFEAPAWDKIARRKGRLIHFMTPRTLPEPPTKKR